MKEIIIDLTYYMKNHQVKSQEPCSYKDTKTKKKWGEEIWLK
jgi:hypothetical protein